MVRWHGVKSCLKWIFSSRWKLFWSTDEWEICFARQSRRIQRVIPHWFWFDHRSCSALAWQPLNTSGIVSARDSLVGPSDNSDCNRIIIRLTLFCGTVLLLHLQGAFLFVLSLIESRQIFVTASKLMIERKITQQEKLVSSLSRLTTIRRSRRGKTVFSTLTLKIALSDNEINKNEK